MAQHWGKLQRIHLAVVGPGGSIAFVVAVFGIAFKVACDLGGPWFLSGAPPAGPGGGIVAEFGITQFPWRSCSFRTLP